MKSIPATDHRAEPFQFRARRQTIMVLYLFDSAHPAFLELLHNKIAQAETFFKKGLVIIDLAGFSPLLEISFLDKIVSVLQSFNLIPLGVQGGDISLQDKAEKQGYTVFPLAESEKMAIPKPKVKEQEKKQESVVEVVAPALVISEPIRSGQRIYAKNRDLICTSTVSAGADILADGNVHVYAPLRGRVYAGASGNKDAGIFCKSLEAELVSIAGNYKVSEQFDETILKKNVHIFLKNDRLLLNLL